MTHKLRRGAVLLIAGLIAAALAYTLLHADSKEPAVAVRTGAMAPDFTVTGLDGRSAALSDYRGKGVLLNFWASWCGPCTHEMPRMNEAYLEGIPDVEIVAVNVGESRGTANEFAMRENLAFPVLLDPSGEAARKYRVVGLPATFLIDPDGKIAAIRPGELTSASEVKKLLQSLSR
ncbi:peroxiredoxin family protein [Paenibacillus chitinolyticus]|uniref:peroxiredoxin family protein n=1 Tax=Paenibacillus chitinolyticus TaxID=79263 RepID=UPI0035D8DE35